MTNAYMKWVTPEMAQEILTKNYKGQRVPSMPVVKKYAEMMKDGKWMPEIPNILLFNKDGELIDGQHRLHAVILSECPQTFEFRTTYDDRTFEYLDNNKPRMARDFVDGTYRSIKVATAGNVWQIKNTRMSLKSIIDMIKSVRRDLTLEEYHKDPEEFELCSALAYKAIGRTKFTTPTALATTFWVLKKLGNADRLEEFVDKITDPMCPEPIVLMFKATIASARQNMIRGTRKAPSWGCAILMKCYEHYCAGTVPKKLRYDEPMLSKYEDAIRSIVCSDEEQK